MPIPATGGKEAAGINDTPLQIEFQPNGSAAGQTLEDVSFAAFSRLVSQSSFLDASFHRIMKNLTKSIVESRQSCFDWVSSAELLEVEFSGRAFILKSFELRFR